MENKSKIIIAGGGHAGIEAALAISRIGLCCSIVTIDRSSLGRLSCNPAIGGLGKSHIVKEIDALGGFMGRGADLAGLQFKTLNKTKGRAVWSLRAQVDKKTYPKLIENILKKDKNIHIVEDEVTRFVTKNNKISHVVLRRFGNLSCKILIITSGTFLNGKIHIGGETFAAGRLGEKPAKGLSESLIEHGFDLGRLKTGTPPRLERSSINWALTSDAPGDKGSLPFSLLTPRPFNYNNEACSSVRTSPVVHSVINKNISSSAMFSGKITATGPRYCPSIEDKVFRFKERGSHLLFLEPEWSNSTQIYLNGFSTSLPAKIQLTALKKIPAFKDVLLRRPGYAIEYDYSPPFQLKQTLESKKINGLFLAGQINGTSGYEEAAGQGLVAGANAALLLKGDAPLILDRSSSYIGVMIGDLVTSHLKEPYRMFSSRAENRLYLRPDNVYQRLYSVGVRAGLINKNLNKKYLDFFACCEEIERGVNTIKIKKEGVTFLLSQYIKRPEVVLLKHLPPSISTPSFYEEAAFSVETKIKYKGYIKNESNRVLKMKKNLGSLFPVDFDFMCVPGLSKESIERLRLVLPENLYQASLIDGIRPTDLLVLSLYIKKHVSRET